MKRNTIFILAGVFILITAAFVFRGESPRAIEKFKTKNEMMSFLQDRGVENPKVSIKGNKVTVEWISADNQASIDRDLNCMERIRVMVRGNEFINKVQVYIYASKDDMMNGEPKGQMTDNHMSLNIPSEARDWFAEKYGPPTRAQSSETEAESEEETSLRPTEPRLIEPSSTDPKETYGAADIRTKVPELGEHQYSEQEIADMTANVLNLTQEILAHPGKCIFWAKGMQIHWRCYLMWI